MKKKATKKKPRRLRWIEFNSDFECEEVDLPYPNLSGSKWETVRELRCTLKDGVVHSLKSTLCRADDPDSLPQEFGYLRDSIIKNIARSRARRKK